MISAKAGTFLLSLVIAGVLVSDAAAQTPGLPFATSGVETLYEGQPISARYWSCLWLGYGSGSATPDVLALKPKASTTPPETHSALVRSKFALGPNWDISVTMTTDSQLRTRKVRGKQTAPAPHPWEVAWLLANMKEDGSAGLYFILKTNGVELGAYRETGEQFFLYTGTTPKNQIGTPYLCRLQRIGNKLIAYVNGSWAAEASLDALGSWPLGDRIGLYTEDAAVRFGRVSVTGAAF